MAINNFNFLKEMPTFLVNREFDEDLLTNYFNFIKQAEENNENSVVILINSSGGKVSTLQGMLDLMKTSPVHHVTIGSGIVASSALLLLMAGDTRYAYEDTLFMSHQYAWSSSGKHHELNAARKAQDISQLFFLKHYKKYTGLSEKTILAKLLPAEDVWFDGNEALNFGIIDDILDPRIKPQGKKEKKELENYIKNSKIKEARMILEEFGK